MITTIDFNELMQSECKLTSKELKLRFLLVVMNRVDLINTARITEPVTNIKICNKPSDSTSDHELQVIIPETYPWNINDTILFTTIADLFDIPIETDFETTT